MEGSSMKCDMCSDKGWGGKWPTDGALYMGFEKQKLNVIFNMDVEKSFYAAGPESHYIYCAIVPHSLVIITAAAMEYSTSHYPQINYTGTPGLFELYIDKIASRST
jgi:hypothetical protein